MIESPASTPPETFLHFTSTAWTAIGSIISAGSLIFLAGFNLIYLRRAHEQSVAAREQADVAKRTLDALQSQINHDKRTDYMKTQAIISGCAVELAQLAIRLKGEIRTTAERFSILPDDWNEAVVYISREFPEIQSKIMFAGSSLKGLEGDIDQLLRVPFNQRGPNSSTGQRIQNVAVSLNKFSFELNSILAEMSK